MGKKQFYAVVKGRRPGLYRNWEECSTQVLSFPGNVYKGFGSEEDAMQYLEQHGVQVQRRQQHQQLHSAPSHKAAQCDAAQLVHGSSSAAVPSSTARAAFGGTAAATLCLDPSGRTLRLEFDGASKRNPGPAGFGAVLYDNLTNVEVTRLCQYMGPMHTNNQAEYAGLIAGLQAALELGCERIEVRGDSTLIIKQVLGQYRVKNEGLMPYHAAAVDLSRRFKSFKAQQVPREQNKVADALSNEALTNYTSGRNPHIWTLTGFLERSSAQLAAGAGEAGEEEEWAGAGAGGAFGEKQTGTTANETVGQIQAGGADGGDRKVEETGGLANAKGAGGGEQPVAVGKQPKGRRKQAAAEGKLELTGDSRGDSSPARPRKRRKKVEEVAAVAAAGGGEDN